MQLRLPDYEIAIFKVIPTILANSLNLELRDPYDRYVFKDGKYISFFQNCDVNVVLIVDSICLNELDGYLYDRWIESGKLILSSVAPSTTANAVGSIYIGLPPELSGLIASKFYVPEIGNFVDALYGKALGSPSKVSLDLAGVKLESLLWEEPVLSTVNQKNLYFVDILPNFIRGGLENFYNSNIISFHYDTGLDSVFETRSVVERFLKRGFKGIVFVYFHNLDAISHKYGYISSQWKKELEVVNTLVRLIVKELRELSKRHNSKINIFVLSDHGHVEPKKDFRVDENVWTKLKEDTGITEYLASDRFGFIYLKNGDKQWVKDKLKEFFGDHADVMTIDEAIKLKLWPELKSDNIERFLSRAGQIVLIPKKESNIVFEKESKKRIVDDLMGLGEYRDLIGRHGSLTEEEMIVPFIPIIMR